MRLIVGGAHLFGFGQFARRPRTTEQENRSADNCAGPIPPA